MGFGDGLFNFFPLYKDKENGGIGSSNYKSSEISYGDITTIFNTIPGGEVPNPHQEKMIIKNLMNKEWDGPMSEMITFHKGIFGIFENHIN